MHFPVPGIIAPDRRARCAKDTDLTNLPLRDLNQDRIWCALVALARDVTA